MESRWSEYDNQAPPSQTYPPPRQPQPRSPPQRQQSGLSPYFSGNAASSSPPSRQFSNSGESLAQSYANPSFSTQSFHSPTTPQPYTRAGYTAPRSPANADERDPFTDGGAIMSPARGGAGGGYAQQQPLDRGLEDDYPSASPEADRSGQGFSNLDVPREQQPKRASRLPFGLGGSSGGAGAYNASHWNAATDAARKTGRTTTIIAVIVLLVLVAGGVTAGVIIHNKQEHKNAGKTTASSSGLTQGGDPSNFPKDPRLHQSFWGFAYTPLGSQLPECGADFGNVTEDMQIMSQLTTRIHMYGADCNQSSFVLDAIAQTKVNMSVWLGIYVTDEETDFTRQLQETVVALQAFGVDNVEGVIVGNEFILDADPDNNDAAADKEAIANLTVWMNQTRTTLAGLNLPKTIPVGTADAGSKVSAALGDVTDFIMANVHPYFGGVPIEQAAVWTWNYYEDPVVAAVEKSTNAAQPVYIAETGWPTEAMPVGPLHDGGAYPSIPNLQTFLDTFVCQANNNGTLYFFFEAFDEPWKSEFGGVEPYWGLFDSSKNLKNITIPDCATP